MSELLDNDLPQSALAAIIKSEGEQARLTERLAAAEARIAQAELDDKVRAAAYEAGVPSSAIPDVLNRGRASLAMRDGRVTGPDGTFTNLQRWMASVRDAAPHLFEGVASTAAATEAPKPAGPVGNVKRAAFDAMTGKEKHAASLAFRAGTAKLVD